MSKQQRGPPTTRRTSMLTKTMSLTGWTERVFNIYYLFTRWAKGWKLGDMYTECTWIGFQYIRTVDEMHTYFSISVQLHIKKGNLDVQLEKKGPKILTSVFRKKTHTDQYLHFDSNHPARVKRGIIQCLGQRVEARGHVH